MDSIENQIKSVEHWIVFNLSALPFIISYTMRIFSVGVHRRYPQIPFSRIGAMHFIKGGNEGHALLNEDAYRHSAEYLFLHLDQLKQLYDDFSAGEQDFYKQVALMEEQGDNYLHENFNVFIKAFEDFYIPGACIDGFLVYSDPFVQQMKQKYPNATGHIETLVQPFGQTFLAREKLSLMRIGLLEDQKVQQEELVKHCASFHWIQNGYKHVEGLSVDYFEGELGKLQAIPKRQLVHDYEELKKEGTLHKEQCVTIGSSGVFESEDYERLLWLGKIAWWVDKRKECNILGNYYIGRFLRLRAVDCGMPYDDAAFLLPEELDEVFKKRKIPSNFPIEERKQTSMLLCDHEDRTLFLSGAKAEAVWLQLVPPVSGIEMKEVKGAIGYRGVMQGIARVVMDPKDVKTFNPGDILVTGMTRPEYLSLMKLAGAFVTDEGGITCHAAIVARELKKPCIIGTKIATQVLKDGELVEVDAINGVVRKLT